MLCDLTVHSSRKIRLLGFQLLYITAFCMSGAGCCVLHIASKGRDEKHATVGVATDSFTMSWAGGLCFVCAGLFSMSQAGLVQRKDMLTKHQHARHQRHWHTDSTVLPDSMSCAGVFWVVCAELFSMAAKSAGMALATASLFLSGALADLLFPVLVDLLDGGAFVVFGLLSGLGGVYVWAELPETKGLSLLEVQAALQQQYHSLVDQE